MHQRSGLLIRGEKLLQVGESLRVWREARGVDNREEPSDSFKIDELFELIENNRRLLETVDKIEIPETGDLDAIETTLMQIRELATVDITLMEEISTTIGKQRADIEWFLGST